MKHPLLLIAATCVAVSCCSLFQARFVIAQAPSETKRGHALADMKLAAWEALLDANDTSLDMGREQKFLGAIRAYEDYLEVSPGEEFDVLLQLATAHVELARLYEVERDYAARNGQYREAAEVHERIASSEVFSEDQRVDALSSAVGLYASSGDLSKSQQCRAKLKNFQGKGSCLNRVEETIDPWVIKIEDKIDPR